MPRPRNRKSTQKEHPHYSSWRWWVQACLNQNCPDYPNHGGRGIEIEFSSFEDFADYVDRMGTCPAGYRLARIDQNDNFRPGNLMFAEPKYTYRNNMRSIQVEIGGETRNFCDWVEHFNIAKYTAYNRLYKGMTPEQALTKPIRPRRKNVNVR